MADVFQFKPEVVGEQFAASGAAPMLGVSGGGGNRAPATQTYDPSESLGNPNLPDFLADAFEPQLQKAKQAKFWSGFTQALAGKTAVEIHEEQPWYAKVFGPTNYELGAETYHVMKAGADMQSEFMQRMPDYKQLTPEQVAVEYAGLAQNMQTGNLYTDALMQKQFMERAPAMFEAHAKARYQWQQQELFNGFVSTGRASTKALQLTAQNMAGLGKDHPLQKPTQEQLLNDTRIMLQTLQPADTMEAGSFMEGLGTIIELAAQDGSWYAVEAIQKSGAFDYLPPEDRGKMEERIERARVRFQAQSQTDPLYVKRLVEIGAQARVGAISAAQVVDSITKLQDMYEAATGDSSGTFLDKELATNAESAMVQYYNAWQAGLNKSKEASEKAATKAAKAQAEAQHRALLASAAASGSLGSVTGVSAEDKSTAFVSAVQMHPASLPDLIVRNFAAPLVGKSVYVNDQTKRDLQTQATAAGENWTPSFEQAYNTWKSIHSYSVDGVSGAPAAIEYYGPVLDARMRDYDKAVRGYEAAGMPEARQFAYRDAFGEDSTMGIDLREADRDRGKEVAAEIDNVMDRIEPELWGLGKSSILPTAQNLIRSRVASNYALLKRDPTVLPAAGVQGALQIALANGLDYSKKFAWESPRGARRLSDWAGMEKGQFDTYFDDLVTNRLHRQGMKVDDQTSVSFIRIGDDATGPRMLVIAQREGKQVMLRVGGDDIKTLRNNAAEMKRTPSTDEERPDIGMDGFVTRPLL